MTLLHVLCIEMSICINQADTAIDDTWGYGQVRIFSVIMLQWCSISVGCFGHKDNPSHALGYCLLSSL